MTNNTESMTIRLYASGLFSKYGFGDGDIIDGILWDNGLGQKAAVGKYADFGLAHATLIDLVKTKLLPSLPFPVNTEEILTSHNPIRAEYGESEEGLENFFVEVTYEDILTTTQKFIKEVHGK